MNLNLIEAVKMFVTNAKQVPLGLQFILIVHLFFISWCQFVLLIRILLSYPLTKHSMH